MASILSPKSFTKKYPGVVRSLITDVIISKAYDPKKTPINNTPQRYPFKGLWDTGATGSVITQKIIDKCNLTPIGMIDTYNAGSDKPVSTEVYLINLVLEHGVGIAALRVSKGYLGPHSGADMLIGMDIIQRGDFSLSNVNIKTTFSFRIPSVKEADFEKEDNKINTQLQHFNISTKKPTPKLGPNEKCYCGSGKKYKKCHGK